MWLIDLDENDDSNIHSQLLAETSSIYKNQAKKKQTDTKRSRNKGETESMKKMNGQIIIHSQSNWFEIIDRGEMCFENYLIWPLQSMEEKWDEMTGMGNGTEPK